MSVLKNSVVLTGLLCLLMPTFSQADGRGLSLYPHYKQQTPYYKPYKRLRSPYNNERAANYLKRHNVANKYQTINPYLNYDYSIDRSRYSERSRLKPRYSDRFNSLQRHPYGYQRPGINYGYRQGYRQGFVDGYRQRHRGSKFGR